MLVFGVVGVCDWLVGFGLLEFGCCAFSFTVTSSVGLNCVVVLGLVLFVC